MKKILSVTLSLLLAASMPLSALAETYDLAQGSITVEAKADGSQYVSQTGGVQQEQQTTETIINQTDSNTTSTTNTITIQAEKNQTAQVTISDVNIDASSEGKAAISTGGDGSVTIELDGDNTAKSGYEHAGVEKNNGGNLTITDADGDGALNAKGGSHGAGIGGGAYGKGDNITISGSAEVTANGGGFGAGIGGGDYGSGSKITISDNAEVTANGGEYGAGIGGGYDGAGSDITISGSAEVTAKGGSHGAGIGGGDDGDGSDITICDNAEVTATGGGSAAGIGGGDSADGRDILIEGDAKVKANGGSSGAGIGGGHDGSDGSDITIRGNAEVIAIGGNNGAGIGGGCESNGRDILIEGNAKVEATGKRYGAGIGGGNESRGYDITISGDAQVKVSGGEWPDGGSAPAIGGDDDGEITPNTDGLTTGSIGYYAPGADKSQDAPEKLLHNGGSGAHTHTGVTLKSSTAATCLNNATVTYLCSCGAEFTTELLNTALGHTLGEYTSNNDATCMADGTKTAHCTNPGCAYYVTTTDVGTRNPDKHSFTNYVSNNDATCSDAGHKTASCDNGCGATDVKIDENAPALGHTWGTYESNGNATCEQDGTKTAKCVRFGQGGCMATDTVPDTGSKLGHDFTDYIYNDNASYTEDGTETAHCNHAGCNETHTRKAEGTRWALFQVKDEKGWYVTYAESRSGNVLTITVNQNTATLSGTIAGLRVLQASGITTVIFKTTEAESTFHIADLLPGTSYNLTHKNTAVDFTLDGNDIANLLK